MKIISMRMDKMVWIDLYNENNEKQLLFIDAKSATTHETNQLLVPQIGVPNEEQVKRPLSSSTDQYSEVC